MFKLIFRLTKRIFIALALFSIFIVILFRFINPFGSMYMLQEKITNWQINQKCTWKNWDEISSSIKIAVIASEDQNFKSHIGFDVQAISHAYEFNQRNKAKRGASTITQQVAKNMFLWSSRSWFHKALETWFSIWIELFWSKKRILEVYLNIAEWGKGIYGIDAASRYYFNINANLLTLEQASLLAAILPNPKKYHPSSSDKFIANKAKWIRVQVKNLANERYIKELD